MSADRLLIRSDSQLVVGQVNEEYESRDPRMEKYVSLVKQRLDGFSAWKLKHITRDYNEKADALAVVAASLPTTETVILPLLSARFINCHYPGKPGRRGLPFLDGPHSAVYQHERTPRRQKQSSQGPNPVGQVLFD